MLWINPQRINTGTAKSSGKNDFSRPNFTAVVIIYPHMAAKISACHQSSPPRLAVIAPAASDIPSRHPFIATAIAAHPTIFPAKIRPSRFSSAQFITNPAVPV
ncbi:MAG: hypothetical protein NC102_04275 [Clostridium sp.]|nr:hypothetical protein [Clostridium sp.]